MLPDFERCDGFWQRQDVDRPLLAGWVGTYQVSDLYPNGMPKLGMVHFTPDKAEKLVDK